MSVTFQFIGSLPDRHAGRVIAEMLRDLARARAQVLPAIGSIGSYPSVEAAYIAVCDKGIPVVHL
jgi:hypothetical protein